MMHIEITTLTPLHIGTGRQFQGNMEYLYFQRENVVSIINERKILDIIGAENINQWVHIINRKDSLLAYLEKRKTGLQAADTASRILPVSGKPPSPQNTIKEYIHSGNGKPILPGSSLKGAIRTAYFAREVAENKAILENKNILYHHRDNRYTKQREVANTQKFVDDELDYHLIGKDPNHDYFRLLRLSDFFFRRTECMLLQTLNETQNGFKIKEDVSQFVECIPTGETALGRLQVPEKLRELALNKNQLPGKVAERFTKQDLVSTINQHTLRLLNDEIKKWQGEHIPEPVAMFLQDLKRVQSIAEQCGSNSCVLRLGHGSGFRFMTGDWQDVLSDEIFDKLMNKLQKPFHRKYEYPKSRRLGYGGTPMGFIKLTLLTEEEYRQNLAQEAQKQQEAAQHEQIRLKEAAQAAEAERLRQEQIVEAARKAEEEARKPRYFTDKVKPGDTIDAYCLGPVNRLNPKMKKFRLLIGQPGQEQEVTLSYYADLDQEVVHQVKVKTVSKKGVVQSIDYAGIK